MQASYIQARDLSDRAETCCTELVAALAAFGYPVLEHTTITDTDTDGEPKKRTVWTVGTHSPDSPYTFSEIVENWYNKEWFDKAPNTDPLAIVRAAFKNRRALIKTIKEGHSLVLVKTSDRRFMLVRDDAPEAIRAAAMRHLEGADVAR